MKSRLRDGPVSAKVDTSGLKRIIDEVHDGAITEFTDVAEDALGPVLIGARDRWPVDSGESLEALRMREQVTPDLVRVGLVNAVRHAYYVRFSVRLQEELEEEARLVGQSVRTGAPRGLAEESAMAARVIAARFKRAGTEEELRVWWLRQLHRTHGRGAPSEKLAGKHAWNTLVAAPARRQMRLALDKVASAVARVAEGV